MISLLQPREAMFGDDLAYAFILGTALLQSGDVDKGEAYVAKVFGAGESAESHLLMGMAQLTRQDYPVGEAGAGARSATQSAAADRALTLRPRAARARRAAGGRT